MKIFISYRRKDSTYLVGRIRDQLIAVFGDGTVFRDLDDIPAGVDFRTILEKETGGCRVSSNVGNYQTTKHLHWYVHSGNRIRHEDGSPIKT